MRANPSPGQRGFTLIEMMVGIVIGMIAVLVIYQMYSVAEGFKRNTTAMGDAQQSGLLSSFMLSMQLANAGAGIATAAQDLASCPVAGDFASSFHPIPVVITDSGADLTPDSFELNYSVASTLASSALFAQGANPNSSYQIQSPSGIHNGDLIVAITTPGGANAGPCASSVVTADPGLPNGNGVVTVTHTGIPIAISASGLLFDMGPAANAQKIRYTVVNGVLFATPLLDPATGQPIAAGNLKPIPIISNVVDMKLQYGIDDVGDGLLHNFYKGVPPWDEATLLAADVITLNKIKAVRITIIVRSEQFDTSAPDATFSIQGGTIVANYPRTVAPPVGNWRYKMYETTVPLRNPLWNKTL